MRLAVISLLIILTHPVLGQSIWTTASPALDGFAIDDLEVDARGWVFAQIGSDVWVSKDTLGSWESFYDGLSYDVFVSDTTVFVSDYSSGLHVSNGHEFVSQFLPGIDLRSFVIPSDNEWIAGGGAGQLFRSMDRGVSWSVMNPEQLLFSDEYVETIKSNSNSIIYTTREVPRRSLQVIGSQFTVIDDFELEGLQESGGQFFAFDSFEVIRSNDGVAWEVVGNPDQTSVLTGLFVRDGVWIVSDFQGVVLKSTDQGQNWEDISAGLPDDPDAMAMDDSGYLFAAVGNLVFKTTEPLSSTSGVPAERLDEMPVSFSVQIKSAYPNPSSQSQTVEIVITKPGRSIVEVFDASGKRIAKLVDAVVSPQVLRLDWRPENSGVYYLRASLEGESVTKTLVHIK